MTMVRMVLGAAEPGVWRWEGLGGRQTGGVVGGVGSVARSPCAGQRFFSVVGKSEAEALLDRRVISNLPLHSVSSIKGVKAGGD